MAVTGTFSESAVGDRIEAVRNAAGGTQRVVQNAALQHRAHAKRNDQRMDLQPQDEHTINQSDHDRQQNRPQ